MKGQLLRLLQCLFGCLLRKPIKGESNGIRCGRPTTRGEERGTVPLSTEVVSVGGGLQPNPPTTQPPSCHPSNTQFFCSQRVARWVHAFFLSVFFLMYKNKKLVLSHCKDLGSNKIVHWDDDIIRVRKNENFPDSKIFVARTFRIKCVNCINFHIRDKYA